MNSVQIFGVTSIAWDLHFHTSDDSVHSTIKPEDFEELESIG